MDYCHRIWYTDQVVWSVEIWLKKSLSDAFSNLDGLKN
jgi:hypothetical protein